MPPILEEAWSLTTPSMAKMHADTTWWRSDVGATLGTLFGVGAWQTTYFERLQVSAAPSRATRRRSASAGCLVHA